MSEKKKSRTVLRAVVLLAVLAGVGFGLWKIFLSKPAMPANIVPLTGRIEGDDSAISPKVSGRIVEIHFREGDSVKAGEVIATLDDQQLRARVQQAQEAVTAAQAQQKAAQGQIAVLEDQLKQTELQTGQSALDAESRVRQAEEFLSTAQAQQAQQEATLKLAVFDREAYTRLAKEGAVSERQGKQAESTAESQEATVAAARRQVDSARAAVNIAKANLTNPQIHTAQTAGIRKQMLQQESMIASAAAETARARSQLIEAQANLQDLTVVAPFSGTVVTRTAEPGEVVQAGTAIVTLLDLNKVYLRGFVPEGEIGRIKVGQTARVYLDSDPRKALEAIVSRIDPQATFTPENTYFRDDRVKQVVGLKLQMKSGFGFAKPGMPAEGEVLVEPK